MTPAQFKKKHGKLGNCAKVSLDIVTRYMSRFKEVRKKVPPEIRLMLGRYGEAGLANGLVFHPVTGWHLHAWVEDGLWCYDFANGNKAIILKQRYYDLGQCKDVKLYSREEALQKAKETGRYGFWDFPANVY